MTTTLRSSQKIRRKVVRAFLGLFSISTMLFVFQACYGTPQDFGQDILIEGQVKSQSDNSVIQGIRVGFDNLPQYTATDADGKFSLYCPRQDSYEVIIQDEDGEQNGSFINSDTIINLDLEQTDLFLSISLKDQ